MLSPIFFGADAHGVQQGAVEICHRGFVVDAEMAAGVERLAAATGDQDGEVFG